MFVAAADGVSCPACAATSIHIVHGFEDVGRAPGAIGECAGCGLVFTVGRIPQDFSEAPESAYFDDWKAIDFDAVRAFFIEVSAAYERNRRVPGTSVNWNPSILDVGCGAGHILPHFRAHRWEVRGVDPWRSLARAGGRYYGLTIDDCRFEEADIPERAFEVVLCGDVLQFTADPLLFLEKCRLSARPGGLLYVTVPNFASAASKRDGWAWPYFVPACYLNYFTPETLGSLAERAGFEAIEITPFGGTGDDFLRLLARSPGLPPLTWQAIAGDVPDAERPRLDREELDGPPLSEQQAFWRENGYLVLPGFLPDELIERYCRVREKITWPHGWNSPQPYLDIPEVMDLCVHPPLSRLLEHLIGEPMGLHLNLTGWVSSERGWHQDDYLNPDSLNGFYAAVWMALDDISPDSGPFEFVPGSHRWPLVRQDKILGILGRTAHDRDWAWESEGLLSPFFETEITRRHAQTRRFQAAKGDVLIWHSRLVHRGARPERPGVERRALISHFSAIDRRKDMPPARRHGEAGWYFDRSGEVS